MQKVETYSYWYSNFLDGLKSEAARRSYTVQIVSEETFNKNVENRCQNIPLIISGHTKRWLSDNIKRAREFSFHPIVCSPPEGEKDCSSVKFELKECVEEAIDYLLWCGKRNIALIGLNLSSVADELKQNTFTEHCKLRNIEKFITLPYTDSLAAIGNEFLTYNKEEHYNGFICANDTVAVYIMEAAEKAGINIPEDAYIIGMGNTAVGRQLKTPLTSISLDYFEMGRQAVNIFRYIKNETSPVYVSAKLPCPITVRASTNYKIPGKANIPAKKITNEQELYSHYFSDPDISEIIFYETIMLESDEIDKKIMKLIINKSTYEEMSSHLHISDRTVRYRVMKIMKKFNVNSKKELETILKSAHLV